MPTYCSLLESHESERAKILRVLWRDIAPFLWTVDWVLLDLKGDPSFRVCARISSELCWAVDAMIEGAYIQFAEIDFDYPSDESER